MYPKRGGKCCVRSSTDTQWYRAVIDTLEDDTATITFIDFGTSETVMTEEPRYARPDSVRQAPFAIQCCLAGLDDSTEWTQDDNDVFLKKTQDKDLLVTLNQYCTGHADVQLRGGSVDITSLFPRRMTLTSIVEKLPSNGKSMMTDAEQQDDKLSTCQAETNDLVGHKFDDFVSHVL